jgi:hypothetical protein
LNHARKRRGETDMVLNIRKVTGLFLGACVLTLSGCAQQGGGLLQPTPKQIISGKNTIVPSSAALSMEATNFCNAQAQVDYAGLVLYCEGKSPALPLSISTTYQTQSTQFSCQVYGYTNSSNQLIVPQTVTLGNCPTGVAPAPVSAPSGAAPVKTSALGWRFKNLTPNPFPSGKGNQIVGSNPFPSGKGDRIVEA